jgi:adenine-specific DNA-methyltransferase
VVHRHRLQRGELLCPPRLFLGAATDPYKALKTTLKAEIDEEAWSSLHSDTSRPFPKPKFGRIAVKVINHLGDEVMKVFSVQ